MKRLFAIILACVMVLSLGACGGSGDTDTTTASGSYEINWSYVPDNDLVGAWVPAEDSTKERVLFTDDGKLRVVYGTVVFDSSLNYGVDGYGNKSCYTEGTYLYGQWSYKIDGDTLTVKYSDGDKVFKRIEYTPITIEAKADFVKNDKVVGKWINKMFNDSYEFTADGYAIYRQKYDDGLNVYETEVKHAYTVDGNKINLYFYKTNDKTEVLETKEFSIDGTCILIGGADYYLNGEGSPEATQAPTAVALD